MEPKETEVVVPTRVSREQAARYLDEARALRAQACAAAARAAVIAVRRASVRLLTCLLRR